MVIYNSKYPVL